MKNNNPQFTPNSMQTAPYGQGHPENMYPQIYHDVYPLVTDAVNRLMASGVMPTPEMINSIVDGIIRNSGMWYEDEDDSGDPLGRYQEAVPAVVFGRDPYYRRRRGHHNRNTLRDVIRILLLGDLFGRNHGHRPY